MERVERLDLMDIFKKERRQLDFVLPGLLRGTVALLVGPGGVSKSFLALQTAASIAMGQDLWHLWSDGERLPQGRVVVLNLEDTPDVLAVRLWDICQSLNQTADNEYWDSEYFMSVVNRNVDVMPLYGQGVSIGQMNPDTRQIEATGWLARIEAYVKGGGSLPSANLVILDTFNRSLGGLDENSSGQMGPVLGLLEGVCKRVGCSFMIIHHVNKLSMVSGSGAQQQAIRGASAITDNCRWQTNLSTMSKEDGDKRGINTQEGYHKKWVQVDLSKVNYGPPLNTRWLKRGEGGVLDGRQTPPDPMPSRKKKGKGEYQDD